MLVELGGVLIAFLYILFNQIGNIPIRRLSVAWGSAMTSFVLIAAGIVPLLVGVYLLSAFSITSYSLLVSAVAGVFFAFGYLFFYRTIESEMLSSSAGLFAIQPALLFIFGAVVLGEPISVFDVLGAVLILFGIALITKKKGSLHINRAFAYGIIGNIFWTVYWIMTTYAIQGVAQPILQLTISRVVGCVVVGLAVLLTLKAVRKEGRQMVWAEPRLFYTANLAGVLNGVGTVLFALIIVLNFLAVGSIITALGPALLAIFVILIYKEKPERMKLAGIAAAVVGACLMAL